MFIKPHSLQQGTYKFGVNGTKICTAASNREIFRDHGMNEI